MDQLIPFMLKSVLLAGTALLFLRLLRGTSASARSVFAHIALLAMIAMPVADMVLPSLNIALPVAARGAVETALFPAFASSTGENDSPSATAENILPLSSAKPDALDAPLGAASQRIAESLDWAVLAYTLPTLCLLFFILLGTGRLFRLRARARMLTDPVWLGALARAKARMGGKLRTALMVSDDIPSPISSGLIRPMILLDRQTLALDDRAEAIIAHELAHVLRFDWAKLILARVATALYWFNPLVWLLAREAHQLREETVDDAVLSTNIADTDYAELLVRTARAQIRRPTLVSAGGVAHGMAPDQRSLTRRIRRVLDTGSARGPATFRLGIGMMVGTLAIALPLAALSFEASGPSMATVAPRPTLVATVMRAVTTATQQSAGIFDEAMELPSIAAEAKEPTVSHATYAEAPLASGAPGAETPAPHHASIAPSPILLPVAALEAAPVAAQTRSYAPADTSDIIILPSTEASLRRYIESLQRGQPNYEEMTPELADAVRQQLPGVLDLIKKWGALRSIKFMGVRGGADIYQVAFEHGRAEWQIAPLTPDGKVQGRAVYELRTLVKVKLLGAGFGVQLRSAPDIPANDLILPRPDASLRPMGKNVYEVRMPGLADTIGPQPEKLYIRYNGNREHGMLHVEGCRVKQSSGDTDVDLIPCQAITYCAAEYGAREEVPRDRHGPLWPRDGEFDQKCVKPRMEAMVKDLHDRRSRAREAL